MDEKLTSTIDKIVMLSRQNADFAQELRRRLGMASLANAISPIDDSRIDDIYEYCIEKVVRCQTQEFYGDFPIPSAVSSLVDDFCRMESFWRKDNFGDFCLSLYQQVECIANKLCVNRDVQEVSERMWGYPAYVKSGKGIIPSIDKRTESDYTVASLVFPGQNKKTGLPYAVEKSKVSLQALYAMDKVRAIVYLVGYRSMMRSSDYDAYKELVSLLNDIYQCRNMNHRGNSPTSWEAEVQERVLSHKAVYYFKFLGALTQFVEQIKEGWQSIPAQKAYTASLPVKPVSGLRIVGKIELPQDSKRYF